MTGKISTILSQAVAILAEGLKPKHIYLFGSFARGTEHPDSDFDFLIVTDLDNNKKIELTQKARRLLLRRIFMPVDIIVCDAREFEDRKKNPSTFEYTVANEGILMYGT